MNRATPGIALFAVALCAVTIGCRRVANDSNSADDAHDHDTGLGASVYIAYCSGCHGPDGAGSSSGGPPLAGSRWVIGPRDRLIAIVLHGVRGRIEAAGVTKDAEMPGFGAVLDDARVAALLNHLRHRFAVASTLFEPETRITVDRVAEFRHKHRHRQRYWSVDELTRID